MYPNETSLFSFRGLLGVRVDIGHSMIMLLFLLFMLGGIEQPIWTMTWVAMLVVSIYLHELGHAWGSLVSGVQVDRIMLYGGGGFCQHRATRDLGKNELIVIMGPLVNLALWALAGLGVWAIGAYHIVPSYQNEIPPSDQMMTLAYGLSVFARINLFLFALNLIPIQPLDGGKLLQLGLLRMLPRDKALRITGAVGVVFCVLWIPAMLWVFVTYGFLLLFFPSFRLHLAIMRGQITG